MVQGMWDKFHNLRDIWDSAAPDMGNTLGKLLVLCIFITYTLPADKKWIHFNYFIINFTSDLFKLTFTTFRHLF